MINQQDVTNVIKAMGTPLFGRVLFQTLQDRFRLKQLTAFSVERDVKPSCVIAEGGDEQESHRARALASDYRENGYRVDHTTDRFFSGRVRQSSVFARTPDQVGDAAFRFRFYDEPQLGPELVLCAPCGSRLIYLSGYRDRCARDFDGGELDSAQELAPLLVSMLEKHLQFTRPDHSSTEEAPTGVATTGPLTPQRRQELLAEISTALLLEPNRLSHREATICAHIVLGFTTVGIGLRLGMSTNTVGTYRKRAYQKLGISSQNELFLKCLNLSAALGGLHARSSATTIDG